MAPLPWCSPHADRHGLPARRPVVRDVLAAFGLMLAARAEAQTLPQVIATAWATNPELASARARQEALAETPEQARAGGRLTAGLGSGAGYDRLGYERAGTVQASAALPIWTGGRIGSAVRAAEGDVAAGAQTLRDAEAAILQQVVFVYADLLYNQQAAAIARVGIERLDAQVAQTQLRFDLGQATRTDVAQLQARRAEVAANLADAEAALTATQAAYRAVVGQEAGALSTDVTSSALLPATLADARDAATRLNPVLLAQRRTVTASAARIRQARAERAPLIDLAVAYGRGLRFGDDGGGFVNAASVGVSVRLPLLTGGLVASRVRQAEATWRADRFRADALTRDAVREADAAWADLVAAQIRVRAGTDGLAAADLALRGVRAEYELGLRSTIDILVADQSLRGAQLDLARAQADVLKAQATLLRATGRMQVDAFR